MAYHKRRGPKTRASGPIPKDVKIADVSNRTMKYILRRDRKILAALADMDGKLSARYARKPKNA